MKEMRRAILMSALALSSCALDASGLGAPGDGGNADDMGDLPDGAPLAGGSLVDSALLDGALHDALTSDAAVCTPDGSVSATACFTLPSGWNLIAFLDTQASSCPAGFASIDLVEGPVAGSTVCACASGTVTTAPSCTGGKVGLAFDTDSSVTCGTGGDPTKLTNNPAGQCLKDIPSGTRPSNLDVELVAPPPAGGNCTAPAVSHGENVIFGSRDRACVPANPASIGCVGNICAPSVAAPFRACLVANGDQSCPGPFTTRHVVGTDVTFDCTACASSLSATCTGTMTFYTDTMCTMGAVALPADPVCRSAAALSGNSYSSYRYAGTVATALCGPPDPPAPPANLALVGEQTICCAP